MAGEPDDLAWHQNWLAMIREASEQGRRFRRVRVVGLPLSDYSQFGLWISQFANEAGDDIRYLNPDQAEIDLPEHDYWLFDSRKLVKMHFGGDDRFLGGEMIADSPVIVQHNYWRDVAWHYAVPRREFRRRIERT